MSKRFRLTKASKILIVFLIVALIGGGVFAAHAENEIRELACRF